MIQYDIKYNEWNERGQPGAPVQLFNVFKDSNSHNALNDTRRQYVLEWTMRHIERGCRSYCNSTCVIPKKSRISFYLWMTSCVYLSLWRHRGSPTAVLKYPSASYGSVIVTVQTCWEHIWKLFCRSELAKNETSNLLHISTGEKKLFYHYYHNRKAGKNAAQIYKVKSEPTLYIPLSLCCKSHIRV